MHALALVFFSFLVSVLPMPSLRLTYGQYVGGTYANSTVGFAARLGSSWRVEGSAGMPFWPPTGTEEALTARSKDVTLRVEISRISRTVRAGELQPAIMRNYGDYLQTNRYQEIALGSQKPHGLEYSMWVYRLHSPDSDNTYAEALFVHNGFAVRLRTICQSDNFARNREMITAVFGSLVEI